MALFRPSALTFLQAKTIVADAVGGATDNDTLLRAGRAIRQAFMRWQNHAYWKWTLVSALDTAVSAPFQVTNCTISNGSNHITQGGGGFATVEDLDLLSSAAGFGLDTRVDARGGALDGNNIYVTRNATGSASNSAITFSRDCYALPADFRSLYDARLMVNRRALAEAAQRDYDRARPGNEPATPTHYMLFNMWGVGATGIYSGGSPVGGDNNTSAFLRLIPPPTQSDFLLVRYYRTLYIPAFQTSTSDTTDNTVALDLPQDYELGFLGLAKYYFLLDKGGNDQRMAGWKADGEAALEAAEARDLQLPDTEMGFLPGAYVSTYGFNPNDIRPFLEQP